MKVLFIALIAGGVAALAFTGRQENRAAPGSVSCIPYNPATLKLEDAGSGPWTLLREDGASFRGFANRPDAEAG